MGISQGDLSVSGKVTANNIAMGEIMITPVADTVTSANITGLDLAGAGDIVVLVSPDTMVPGTTFIQVTYSAVSASGFTINILRTNTTATRIWWRIMRLP